MDIHHAGSSLMVGKRAVASAPPRLVSDLEGERRVEACLHALLLAMPSRACLALLGWREAKRLGANRHVVIELGHWRLVGEVGHAALHARVEWVDSRKADAMADIVAGLETVAGAIPLAAEVRVGRHVPEDWHVGDVARRLVHHLFHAHLGHCQVARLVRRRAHLNVTVVPVKAAAYGDVERKQLSWKHGRRHERRVHCEIALDA